MAELSAERREALAAQLPGDGAIKPVEYNALIAPPLKVCAALAASRGDQWLATDMACMIALQHLTHGLIRRYREEWGALGEASAEDVLAAAPDAACALVMREAEFAPEAVSECMQALHRARRMLQDAEVIPADSHAHPDKMLTAAWRGLSGGEATTAETLLGAVAGNVVSAVDAWESNRSTH